MVESRSLNAPSNYSGAIACALDVPNLVVRASLQIAAMPFEVSNGSWPCDNAGVLRRRRIAFSSVRCSFLSREARLLARGDAEALKSRKLRGSYSSGARDSRLAFVLL